MNRLQNMRVYLAGPMDQCENQGRDWRAALTPFLQSLNIKIFNPADKPIDRGQEIEYMDVRRQLKEAGEYDQLGEIMREISNVDLRMIDICDFIIAHFNLDILMTGTIHEVVLANMQKKPILVHIEQGKKMVPDWWFGRLDHNEFFSTWGELRNYLVNINMDNKIRLSKRWYFFNEEVR